MTDLRGDFGSCNEYSMEDVRLVRIYSEVGWKDKKKTHAFLEIPGSMNLELMGNRWTNLGGNKYMSFVDFMIEQGAKRVRFENYRINS